MSPFLITFSSLFFPFLSKPKQCRWSEQTQAQKETAAPMPGMQAWASDPIKKNRLKKNSLWSWSWLILNFQVSECGACVFMFLYMCLCLWSGLQDKEDGHQQLDSAAAAALHSRHHGQVLGEQAVGASVCRTWPEMLISSKEKKVQKI